MKLKNYIFQVVPFVILLGYVAYDQQEQDAVEVQEVKPQEASSKLRKFAFTTPLPERLTFAGEDVPLKRPDIYERLDMEIHVNANRHSRTILALKRANRWFPQIVPILKKYNIPEDFKYLAVIESELSNVTSPSGAKGFWQLMKGTARELNLEVNREVDERYDPVKSTHAASQYLLKAYFKFGNWTAAAASYNMGMNGLNKRMEEQKADSYYDLLLNQETSRYLFRVLALKIIMENPNKYGYILSEEELYHPAELKPVFVDKTIPNLVDFAKENGVSYKVLKRYNPWLRRDHLTVRRNTYNIMIAQNPVERIGS